MRRRFLLAFLGVMLVMLLAQDLPLARFVRAVERDRLIARLERDAFVLAGAAEDLLSEGEGADPELLRQTIELYRQREGAHVVVVDTDSTAIAVSDDRAELGDDYSNRPEVTDALVGQPVAGERFSNSLDADLVYVAVPVRSGADIVGAVRITFDAEVIDQRTGDTMRGVVVVGVISLIAAGITAVFLASTVTRPVIELQRTTERVAAGDLTSRAATGDGPPEVRRLATSLNTMTERLSNLLDQQRRFAGDASHQLRTPLTALRLQLEMAQDALGTDPEVAARRIDAASAETERLQRVVEGLLLLARADDAGTTTETVDVGTVVAERADVWTALAAESEVHVTIDPAADGTGIRAECVPQGLHQMIDNLVDNAISVSPPGSTVELCIRTRDAAREPMVGVHMVGVHMVEVHVLDRGPGMSPQQLELATDRFWRAADAPAHGTGLGLAIVDRLARAGGGRLSLRARDGGGLDASVLLKRSG